MLFPSTSSSRIESLRAEVAVLEAGERRHHGVLPFGVNGIDAALPGGGLATGALHEVAGARPTLADEAAATIFVAGIAARLAGPVLWCRRQRDLFAPALGQAGLHPDRVIHAELVDEAEVLAAMEEGLRHAGLAAVIGEVRRLALAPSRRLQLAAEASGVTALVLRRPRRGEAVDEPGAGRTRWRVAPAPSAPLPVPGIARPRWRIDLVRVRGGEAKHWMVEACDAEGRLALVPDACDGSVEREAERAIA
jgi:protein ImuA